MYWLSCGLARNGEKKKQNLALCSVTPGGKDPVAKFKSEVSEITKTDAKVECKCF